MVHIVEGGEGVAILTQPQHLLFEYPTPRAFAEAPTLRSSARDAKPIPIGPRAPQGYWPGAFVLTADLTWLRDDEAVAISALLRTRSGGEYFALFTVEIDRAQKREVWQSRPLYSLYGCAFQATQTRGAGDIRLPFWVLQCDAAPID